MFSVVASFFSFQKNGMLALIPWGVFGFICLILLAMLWPFYSVPTGSRGVITQFGAITKVHEEGLTVLWPWEKLTIFSIRAESVNVQNAEGGTSDTQPVHTSLTVRYSISPSKVSEVFEKYTHTGDLNDYVMTATQESFKAVTAKYTAVDLISKRKDVSDDVYATLSAKISKYGAQVVNIDMTKFSFSESYMEAINDKVTQEQKRLAAENKLLTVQAEQKQKVAIAEAEAGAVKAKADGDSYATLKNATAQAQALEIQNKALSQNHEVLELRRIQVEQTKADRWNGQLPESIYAGAPVPFLNVGSATKNGPQ